jgi:hypothetical protein
MCYPGADCNRVCTNLNSLLMSGPSSRCEMRLGFSAPRSVFFFVKPRFGTTIGNEIAYTVSTTFVRGSSRSIGTNGWLATFVIFQAQ